jgi:hypothetical protein
MTSRQDAQGKPAEGRGRGESEPTGQLRHGRPRESGQYLRDDGGWEVGLISLEILVSYLDISRAGPALAGHSGPDCFKRTATAQKPFEPDSSRIFAHRILIARPGHRRGPQLLPRPPAPKLCSGRRSRRGLSYCISPRSCLHTQGSPKYSSSGMQYST